MAGIDDDADLTDLPPEDPPAERMLRRLADLEERIDRLIDHIEADHQQIVRLTDALRALHGHRS